MACEPVLTLAQFKGKYPDTTFTDDEIEVAVAAAGIVLSGLVHGQPIQRCSHTLFPYTDGSYSFQPTGWWGRQGVAGVSEVIPLPAAVTAVAAVTIDGVALEDTKWSTYSDRGVLRLARTDGGSWPKTSQPNISSGLMLTVITGRAPELLAIQSAAEIANDILSQGLPGQCGMDPHVVSKSAQGVTLAFDTNKSADEQFVSTSRFVASKPEPKAGSIYTPFADGWEFLETGSSIDPATLLPVESPAPPGADVDSFTHTQAAASSSWIIVHNLGYRANVSTFDDDGDEIMGQRIHLDDNTIEVRFNTPRSGVAYVS